MTKVGQQDLRKDWEARVTAFRAGRQSASAWFAAHQIKPRQLWSCILTETNFS